MEKINRELLIKEVSARLPYGVKAKVYGWDEEKGEVEIPLRIYSINTDGYVYFETNDYNVDYLNVDDCLLYLRPISSMTDEEFNSLKEETALNYNNQLDLVDWNNGCKTLEFWLKEIPSYVAILVFDWLNSHHFDYRALIDRGLALEAPEGMYN